VTSPSPLERLAGSGHVLAHEPPDAKEFDDACRKVVAKIKALPPIQQKSK
jgi:hypothetical protein